MKDYPEFQKDVVRVELGSQKIRVLGWLDLFSNLNSYYGIGLGPGQLSLISKSWMFNILDFEVVAELQSKFERFRNKKVRLGSIFHFLKEDGLKWSENDESRIGDIAAANIGETNDVLVLRYDHPSHTIKKVEIAYPDPDDEEPPKDYWDMLTDAEKVAIDSSILRKIQSHLDKMSKRAREETIEAKRRDGRSKLAIESRQQPNPV